MASGRFVLLVGAICLVAVLVIYLLHRFTGKYVKYLIPGVALLITVYNGYLSQTVHNGFGDIVGVIYAMIFGSVAAVTFAVCLIFDYVWDPGKKRM